MDTSLLSSSHCQLWVKQMWFFTPDIRERLFFASKEAVQDERGKKIYGAFDSSFEQKGARFESVIRHRVRIQMMKNDLESQVTDPIAEWRPQTTRVQRANVVLLRVDVHVLRVARFLVILQNLVIYTRRRRKGLLSGNGLGRRRWTFPEEILGRSGFRTDQQAE